MASKKHVSVYRGRDGWWRFRLVAANGEKQTASQPYLAHRNGTVDNASSKRSAKRAASSAHPGVRIVVEEPTPAKVPRKKAA